MSEPLWREEFSIRKADERYVSRRQLTKFLTLTSLGMFAGNLWIVAKSRLRNASAYPRKRIAQMGEIPVGGVKIFDYPRPQDQCLLIRPSADEYVAYSQKCTHLSCAVFYSAKNNRLECPCHQGYFSIRDGSVLQGPPPRPLPRVNLERQASNLIAIGVEDHAEAS